MAETYSSLQTFLDCQQKYYWQQVLNIEPDRETPQVLFFGRIIHDLLEVWHGTGDLEACITRAKSLYQGVETPDSVLAEEMISKYSEVYPTEEWIIEELEREFETAVYHPTNSRKRRFKIRGKKDGVVLCIERMVLEHKTAAMVDSNYIDKLRTDPQILIYSAYHNKPVDGAIYNVLMKPRIKPGDNLDKYRDRLKSRIEASFFTRQYLYWTDEDLEHTRINTYLTFLAIHKIKKTGHYLKNWHNCFVWNRKCNYWDLCANPSQQEFLIETQYRTRPEHPELGGENAVANNEDETF